MRPLVVGDYTYISFFSTSDISYQMCYCCQKLEYLGNLVILWGRVHGRPCEAEFLGGCGRPCSSDWLRHISQPIRGARPPTASQIRPPIGSASHNLSCDLSEPIRDSKSVRPICEAVGGRVRPNLGGRGSPSTASQITWLSSERPWESEHGLTDLRVRSVRPWEANLWGRERPCSDSHGLTDRPLTSASQIR